MLMLGLMLPEESHYGEQILDTLGYGRENT